MKRQLRALLALMLTLGLSLTLGGSAFATVLEPEAITAPFSGYIVKLRASESEVMTLSAAPDCLVPILPDMGYYRVNTKEDAAALIADGMVEMMEPDYEVELLDAQTEPTAPSALAEPVPSKIPNDPAYSEKLQKDLDLIGMKYAWEHDLTGAHADGTGVTVAVIDSGYTPRHEDTPERMLPGAYFYYQEDPKGSVELEVDGATKHYTLKSEYDPQPGAAGPCVTVDDYAKGGGHGTRVTGIIAAKTNNALGIAGVAPKVQILPVRCFTQREEGRVGGFTSNLVIGMNFAVEKGAKIMNMSWGVKVSTKTLREAVEYADKAGVIMVAATGNSGRVASDAGTYLYPASYHQVIGVTSTSNSGDVSDFSQRNDSALLAAPGEGTYTPCFNFKEENLQGYPKYSGNYSGTSFSAPMVAGALALALADDPTLTAENCKLLLRGTATPLKENALRREFGGAGLLNIENLMTRKGRVVTSARYQKTTAKEGTETATLEVDAFLGDRQLTTTHTALMVRYDALGYLAETQNLPITAAGGLSHVSFPIAVQEPGTTYQVFFLDPDSLGVSLPSATCAVPAPPVVAE